MITVKSEPGEKNKVPLDIGCSAASNLLELLV